MESVRGGRQRCDGGLATETAAAGANEIELLRGAVSGSARAGMQRQTAARQSEAGGGGVITFEARQVPGEVR